MKKKFLQTLARGSQVELLTAEDQLPSSFFKAYSSFANGSGGTIYLGIEAKEGKPNLLIGVGEPGRSPSSKNCCVQGESVLEERTSKRRPF